MPFIPISDPADPRLDEYRNVPDPDLLQRHGLFVAEGRLVVRRLLAGRRFAARSVLVTDTARAALADAFDAAPGVPVYVASQQVVDGIAGFNIHRGCLAVGERPAPRPWPGVAADARTVVVLERIANADNVGGIFRSAAAFGADAVLLDEATADPLYRKAIRTSMGAALQVPFARAAPWPAALHDLRAAGFTLVAMTPSTGARPLRACAARLAGRRVALVLGHEGAGVSEPALQACHEHARIPIADGVDSLNVATAGAIALYELAHARNAEP